MKKLLFILSVVALLTSCTSVGDASVENTLVVEQVKSNVEDKQCTSCLQNKYTYRIKLTTNSGNLYYYTNFKHEVGDTLLSIFEFTDHREKLVKNERQINDSLTEAYNKVAKKNAELTLYNELLMGIIQEDAKK